MSDRAAGAGPGPAPGPAHSFYGFTPTSVRQCVLVFGLIGAGCLTTGLIDTSSAIVFPVREAVSADVGPTPDRATSSDLTAKQPAAPPRPVAAAAAAINKVNTAPVRITITGRTKQIPVVPVGVVGNSRLEVPDDPRNVGWWAGGAAPGDPNGTVVLAGHLDSADRGLGVFATLLTVRTGQQVTVRDATGRQHRYQVTTRRSYPRDRLPSWVFQRGGTPRLMLLTCGGRYDARHHHYTQTVVVLAKPVG